MTDKIFIILLEYGAEIGLEGTDIPEFIKWAASHNFINTKSSETHEKLKQNALHSLFKECFEENRYYEGSSSKKLFVLKNEYYFRLIEYRELQESRNASKEANKNAMVVNKTATVAIAISVLAILVGLFVSIFQVITPVSTINQPDLKLLITYNRCGIVKYFKKESPTRYSSHPWTDADQPPMFLEVIAPYFQTKSVCCILLRGHPLEFSISRFINFP